MQLKNWPLDKFIEYDNNPRKNDHAVDRTAAAIQEFGFRVPLLAKSTGELIDGHLRLKAARSLGLDKVPVLIADDMTETQIRAFRISVNKVAELAKWDFGQLEQELQALRDIDYDLPVIGFKESELADIISLDIDKEKDPDACPAPPKTPVSRLGDLWQLGRHRLLCGDSTKNLTFQQLLGELGGVHMVFTDPPYNVNYKGKAGKIKNDDLSDDAFSQLLNAAFRGCFAALVDGGPIYVAYGDSGKRSLVFHQEFNSAGFFPSAVLIWCKNTAPMSRADYHWRHEPILYGWKPTGPHKWYGGRKQQTLREIGPESFIVPLDDNRYALKIDDEVMMLTGDNLKIERDIQTTIINIDMPKKNDVHPTMKPVALLDRFLINSSQKDDLILDPFGGSGSTLIACEKRGRRAALIELDPRFVDVIIERWSEYTNDTAIHQGTGLTFHELATQRRQQVV